MSSCKNVLPVPILTKINDVLSQNYCVDYACRVMWGCRKENICCNITSNVNISCWQSPIILHNNLYFNGVCMALSPARWVAAVGTLCIHGNQLHANIMNHFGVELLHGKCFVLTLNVRELSYLGLTRSISWLLMPWLLTSPGHQQPWCWLCRICKSWSYLRNNFKYLCHINVE